MTTAEFLARERDLHEYAEQGPGREFLFMWETTQASVVVGRSARIQEQVCVGACEDDAVPILRRPSGGGAVLLGSGCLNYTLILNLYNRPQLREISESYRSILGAVGVASGVDDVEYLENDLAIRGLKFSGSAQRRMRRTLLHHGTLLYRFPIQHVARYLPEPARQPKYRNRRDHVDFLTNAPIDPESFRSRLQAHYPEAELVS